MWRHKHRHIDRRPCFSFSVANPLRWALRRYGSDLECHGTPRQKNSAPFRFRGLRKSRENFTSAESFFLSETEVSRGTSVSVMEIGSDLECHGTPRQKNSAPFRFRGLRKSRENFTSAESFFLSETEVSQGTSVSVMENGSDLNCPGASRRRKLHIACDDFLCLASKVISRSYKNLFCPTGQKRFSLSDTEERSIILLHYREKS